MSEYTYNETVIEHEISQDYYCISTGERTWKNRLKRLALYHPDACVVIAENDDGSVCYHVPKSWVKISPPRHVVMTDEQKRKTAERLKAARDKMEKE